MPDTALVCSALLQAAQRRAILDRGQAEQWAQVLGGASSDSIQPLRRLITTHQGDLPQAAKLMAMLPEDDGCIVARSWRQLARLSVGALAETWLVHGPDHKGIAVAKIMHPRLFADSAQRQAWCQNQRDRIAATSHYLLPQLDVFDPDDSGPILISPWLPGRDLDQRVLFKGQTPERRALAYIIHAAKGLFELGKQQRLHGHLKPSNILIAGDARARLGDIAVSRDPRTGILLPGLQTDTIGTLKWAAPECQDGEAGDLRSDIYSLGTILFYLLSGRSPFSGSKQQISKKHRSFTRPDVRRYAPTTSELTAKLIAKCMKIKAEKRYQSPEDFIKSLARNYTHLQQQSDKSAAPATTQDKATDAIASNDAPDSSLFLAAPDDDALDTAFTEEIDATDASRYETPASGVPIIDPDAEDGDTGKADKPDKMDKAAQQAAVEKQADQIIAAAQTDRDHLQLPDDFSLQLDPAEADALQHTTKPTAVSSADNKQTADDTGPSEPSIKRETGTFFLDDD